MFLINFSLLNLNLMSASSISLAFFLIQGQRSNMIFQQMNYLRKSNTSISCDFDCAIHFWSYFNYWGHLQGQKVNFKVKSKEISFLLWKARNMCNTPFSVHFFAILSILGNYSILNNNRFSPSLTLFCYIYDVFYVSYIFFLLNSNPMSVLAWKIWTFL